MNSPSIQDIDRELFYRKHEESTITGVLAEQYDYYGTRISIIPKMRPLFECNEGEYKDKEYFLFRGGRGSGKSESIGEALVLIARREKTRILCTRETQASIDDSVKQVIEDWIDFLGFRHEFTITDKKIIHKGTGTDFIFMGLKAATDKDSVKGVKGSKYVWVEEAQMMSQKSWGKLDPTIRIDGRKLFFSYNKMTDLDVVDSIRRMKLALLVHVNYNENPFLPQTQLNQANELKAWDYDAYLHIWEGQPMAEDASSIILPYSQLSQCVDLHEKFGFGDGHMFAGFDIAEGQMEHHDKNAFAARAGPTLHRVEEWQIKQVYESVRKVHGWYYELGFQDVSFDSVGVGVAAKSEYARMEAEEKEKEDGFRIPYDVIPVKGSETPMGPDTVFVKHGANVVTNKQHFKNVKTQLWWNLRLRLQNSMKLLEGHKLDREGYYLSFSSKIKNLNGLFSELAQATHKLDGAGRLMIDKAPGVKEIQVDGKTKKIKSPNKADATILSYAKDLEFGLRAHGDEVIEEEDVPAPITEWVM